jgi:hypothetical protein
MNPGHGKDYLPILYNLLLFFKQSSLFRELEDLVNEADSKNEGVVNYQGGTAPRL